MIQYHTRLTTSNEPEHQKSLQCDKGCQASTA